jgi:hypothetical protein
MRRITGWRGRLLSLAAKRVLIQACLSSIPIYLLSFFFNSLSGVLVC